MTDETETDPETLSDDQLAVRAYFASDRYTQRRVYLDQPGALKNGPPQFHSEFAAGIPSLCFGLGGLALITLICGIAMPIGIELLNYFNIGRPNYITMMFMVQTMVLPPMVTFAFATVSPMFWYGSIALRFVMATATVVPGCIGFVVTLSYVENGAPQDFWIDFSTVMFICFISIAAIALTVQMWSRWSLSHARYESEPLPSPGIRSLIELTGIAAVGFSLFISMNTSDIIEGIMLFAAIGIFAAIAIISVLIAFLRSGETNRVAAIVGLLFAFAAAYFLNSFFAVMEYGWDVLTYEIPYIAAASLFGAALICGLMWLCLRWLGFCGWRCINRR